MPMGQSGNVEKEVMITSFTDTIDCQMGLEVLRRGRMVIARFRGYSQKLDNVTQMRFGPDDHLDPPEPIFFTRSTFPNDVFRHHLPMARIDGFHLIISCRTEYSRRTY